MENLSINDMKRLAKLRNVDGYENMSRKQLEYQLRLNPS